MNIEQIVRDVIVDYNKRNHEDSLNYALISKVLVNLIRPFENELEIRDVYAICMESLYYLNDIDEDGIGTIDKNDIEFILGDHFSQGLDELLAWSESYAWIPETLEKVLKLSYSIFEIAKEAYFLFGNAEGKDNVDNLFSQMVEAKKELDTLEYKYRSYNEILYLYEQAIFESQLDINTIKGERFIISMRMADYIEDSGIDIIQEEDPFSNIPENSFTMSDTFL